MEDVLDKARTLWPQAIEEMPMNEDHKWRLAEHWSKLHADFRIL